MENGFMMALPERVLHGAVANRDFAYFYGPTSLWLPAVVYKLVGVSITAERLIGFGYQAGLAFGVYAAALRWGRLCAGTCGVLAALMVVIGDLNALPWVAAVALVLWALLMSSRRRLLLAGLLLGLALTFRTDLVVAGVLSQLPVLAGFSWSQRRRFGLGFVLGLLPLAYHLIEIGVPTFLRAFVLDPFRLRNERHLPIPPAGLASAIWFFLPFAATALLAFAGWVLRSHDDDRWRLTIGLALLGGGLFHEIFQRADAFHIANAASISVALLPVAGTVLFTWMPARIPVAHLVGAGAAFLLVLLLAWSPVTDVAYHKARWGLGIKPFYTWPLQSEGRTYYYFTPEESSALAATLRTIHRLAPPGSRVFVGPLDLLHTVYAESEIYYLLPGYLPATRFVDMHPGVGLYHGRQLASDLASADVVILTPGFFNEPNLSRKPGSTDAEERLVLDFCPAGTYERFHVYARCPEGTSGR